MGNKVFLSIYVFLVENILELFGKIHRLNIGSKGRFGRIRYIIQLEQNIGAGDDHNNDDGTETKHHFFINRQLHKPWSPKNLPFIT